MLTLEQLKQAVHQKGITKTDIALLCVAAGGAKDVPTKEVRKFASDAGVKGAKNINFASFLNMAHTRVFKTPEGWELNATGRAHVASLAAVSLATSPAATGAQAQALRDLIPKLKNADAQAFLTEAVVCAEQSLHRAAVVLSWVGAVALMHDHVVANHLAAFNAEMTKKDAKWSAAKNADDVGKPKEHTFLQIIESIGMIGKNVKQQLEDCLKLRNGCGHPNTLKIGPSVVASHLEMLTLNVYAKFA